jgi:uncharacterized protein
MARIFYILALLLASFLTGAQTSEFEKDIERFLSINGSTATYDLAFEQMVAQFKMKRADAPDEIWKEVRIQIFDKEISTLNKMLIPIYMKHFTHSEIKALIEFYQSPIGKKMTGNISPITNESLQISQKWIIGLGQKMNAFILAKVD